MSDIIYIYIYDLNGSPSLLLRNKLFLQTQFFFIYGNKKWILNENEINRHEKRFMKKYFLITINSPHLFCSVHYYYNIITHPLVIIYFKSWHIWSVLISSCIHSIPFIPKSDTYNWVQVRYAASILSLIVTCYWDVLSMSFFYIKVKHSFWIIGLYAINLCPLNDRSIKVIHAKKIFLIQASGLNCSFICNLPCSLKFFSVCNIVM